MDVVRIKGQSMVLIFEQDAPNVLIYELVKFGFLFSTKAAMPDSPASEGEIARSDQETVHAPSC